MLEINYRPIMNESFDEEWEQLSPIEKAICLNYRRKLIQNQLISNALILEVNQIHERYPDFHIGCIPSERIAEKILDFKYQDMFEYNGSETA